MEDDWGALCKIGLDSGGDSGEIKVDEIPIESIQAPTVKADSPIGSQNMADDRLSVPISKAGCRVK